MPRRVGRFLGRAGSARRLLPLSAVAPLLFRCAHARRSRRPLRCAAGRAAALGSVGAGRALSADFVGIEGRPDAAQRLQFRTACLELQGTDLLCALLDGWSQVSASGQRVVVATERTDDYALANLGQLKAVFSFDPWAIDPTTDQNQNGVADWWERHFLGQLSADISADSDGDGVSDQDEYLAGTHPNPNTVHLVVFLRTTTGSRLWIGPHAARMG